MEEPKWSNCQEAWRYVLSALVLPHEDSTWEAHSAWKLFPLYTPRPRRGNGTVLNRMLSSLSSTLKTLNHVLVMNTASTVIKKMDQYLRRCIYFVIFICVPYRSYDTDLSSQLRTMVANCVSIKIALMCLVIPKTKVIQVVALEKHGMTMLGLLVEGCRELPYTPSVYMMTLLCTSKKIRSPHLGASTFVRDSWGSSETTAESKANHRRNNPPS